MANKILKSGVADTSAGIMSINDETPYLETDKYLSEYDTEGKKAVVRENLDVYAKDVLYTKEEVANIISETVLKAIKEYLELDDPHGILPVVQEMIDGMVKSDGSVSFTHTQKGIDPLNDSDLVTKNYVDNLLKAHLIDEDPHEVADLLDNTLTKYAKTSDVYKKGYVYSKNLVDELVSGLLKADGTVALKRPIIGADPLIDGHLATKRYIDRVLYGHLLDVDPHGYVDILNKRLASFAKAKNVYDKTQTYSRQQIDSVITQCVDSYVKSIISKITADIDCKISALKANKFVKQDGSVPFTEPISGVEAVDESDLVTLGQVATMMSKAEEDILGQNESWITNGATEVTVGKLEKGTVLPEKMTLQEIMDAIFYGKSVSLTGNTDAIFGEPATVELYVAGSTADLQYIEVYLDGTLISTLDGSNLHNGKVTIDTNTIYKDTDISVSVFYLNGAALNKNLRINAALPVFVGSLPLTCCGGNVTMEYLKQLADTDDINTSAALLPLSKNCVTIPFYYKFEDELLRKISIAVPAGYPKLVKMLTDTQTFEAKQFDVTKLSMNVAGKSINYNLYVFQQPLSNLDVKVTYNLA